MSLEKNIFLSYTTYISHLDPHFGHISHFGKILHIKSNQTCIGRLDYIQSFLSHLFQFLSACNVCKIIRVSGSSLLLHKPGQSVTICSGKNIDNLRVSKNASNIQRMSRLYNLVISNNLQKIGTENVNECLFVFLCRK